MIRNYLKDDQLYLECLVALGSTPLEDKESDYLHEYFKKMFPITKWGKIDWEKISNKIDIGCEPLNIIPALELLLMKKTFDQSVYIEWSTGSLPIIRSNLEDIINHFDDVTCVAFEKFIFNPDLGYIIEVLPGDEMIVGIIPTKNKHK